MAELGLPAPKALSVPANTLVIANTNGFHRRGAASEVSSRLEIWAFSRSNPFNPLIGFNFKWYNRLSLHVIDWCLQRQDRKAAEQNRRASWHLIDSEEMFEYDVQDPLTQTQAANDEDVKRPESA